MKRQSGVLMPVFSLPGPYSCGNFGKSAYQWIDFLAAAGFSWWQVLPLCLPDAYRSPYMSPASLMGDPAYIDLDALFFSGLLTAEELSSARQKIDYSCEISRLGEERKLLLFTAAKRFCELGEMDAFFREHPALMTQCVTMAKKDALPEKDALLYHRFTQFQFHRQWKKLKAYANDKGISILGDLPFYVSPGSADLQEDPEAFLLNDSLCPVAVAGVPPDYFSESGQFWGNPLYNWEKMEKTDFSWWRKRLKAGLELFDGIRIDHFRAISAFWSIPAGAKSAMEGKWIPGPGMKLIQALKEEAQGQLIIAENLGVLDEDVDRLLKQSEFPGMAVFQFAFDSNPQNPHLPHNYTENTVCYTGTHDNNTLLGFLWEACDGTRQELFDYIGFTEKSWDNSYECILRTLLRSKAGLAIFPIQDLLGFGADTRFNTPGKADGNWSFRISENDLSSLDAQKFYRMNQQYSRI